MELERDQVRGVPEPPEPKELRLAVAMTGGVSLAVWMGGVTAELRRSSGGSARQSDLYRRLCERTGQEPVVDVVSGTSAGGINGALLALATVRAADLDFVRDVWVDDGSFEQLLRAPLEPTPLSLLRGDDYFLPALRRAFDIPSRRRPDDEVPPMQLMITTTLLQGESRSVSDDMGTVLRQVDHTGTFTFETSSGSDAQFDPAKLARAARCSASFPGAFEASFCRVGSADDNLDETTHPDMTGLIDTTMSRFTVDGGLVNNKPIGPALRAVFERPANRPVRRVLTYIVPDPGASTYGETERVDEPPALGRVLMDSLLEIPQAQSITADLEALRKHNRQVDRQRFVREHLVEFGVVTGDGLTEDRLRRYFRLRAERSADLFLDELTRHLNGRLAAGSLPRAWRGAYEFNSEAFRACRAALVGRYEAITPVGSMVHADVFDTLPMYGPAAVERAVGVAIGLVSRATRLCASPDRELREQRGRLTSLGTELHAVLADVPGIASLTEQLRQRLADGLADVAADDARSLADWAADCFEARIRESREEDLAPAMRRICDGLHQLRDEIQKLRQWFAEREGSLAEDHSEEAERLWAAVRALTAERYNTDVICKRLLALEVAQILLALDEPVLEQQVELVQVSAESRNGLTPHRDPSAKLTGLQLRHFGAFYRRSWRANDWLWGRIDGAGWLVHLLLSPARLRELQEEEPGADTRSKRERFREQLLLDLKAIATGEGVLPESAVQHLEGLWDRDEDRVREELEFLSQPPSDAGERASLPHTSIAVARALHYQILLEELPKLRDDIRLDVRGGANSRPTAAWCARFDREWAPTDGERAPDAPIALFRNCPLPREKVTDEVGSDLFTYTMATSAATALRAGGSVVGAVPAAVKPVYAAARGAGVVAYFLARLALLNNQLWIGLGVLAFMGGILTMVVADNAVADGLGLIAVLGAVVFFGLHAAAHPLVRALPAILVAGAAAVLIAGPWLWEPVRPASWLADLAAAVDRNPVIYATIMTVLVLAVLGSAHIAWPAERRTPPVATLRARLDKAAGDDLRLALRVDPAAQASGAVEEHYVRRTAYRLVQAARRAGAHSAVLQLTGDSAGGRLVLEHDGTSNGHATDVKLPAIARRRLGEMHHEEAVGGWTTLEVPIRREGVSAATAGRRSRP